MNFHAITLGHSINNKALLGFQSHSYHQPGDPGGYEAGGKIQEASSSSFHNWIGGGAVFVAKGKRRTSECHDRAIKEARCTRLSFRARFTHAVLTDAVSLVWFRGCVIREAEQKQKRLQGDHRWNPTVHAVRMWTNSVIHSSLMRLRMTWILFQGRMIGFLLDRSNTLWLNQVSVVYVLYYF